jgi:branched-chain amino acid transport system ATP-binding protein
MAALAPLLKVSDVTVRFGGVTAVDDVSVEIRAGEFVGLLGPNGAGKTTLLRVISGMIVPNEGRIAMADRDITGLGVAARVRAGIGLSNQIVRPFRTMTLLENVVLAAGTAITRSPLTAVLHRDRAELEAVARRHLTAMGIGDLADRPAGTQPLGVLKRLEVARALATRPNILLLDEPLAGLSHGEAIKLADTIRELNRGGTTVVLIEHNLGEVMRICPRLVVLDNGRKIADGPAVSVIRERSVVEAYLGTGAAEHALA